MKTKKPLFTKTTLRIAASISIVMVMLYILFNIFSFLILDYQLEQITDSKLDHEIEHILHSLEIRNDSLIVLDWREFNESDLAEVTETPFFLQVYNDSGTILLRSKNLEKFGEIPVGFFYGSDIPKFFENITINDNELRVGYRKLYNNDGKYFGYLQLSTLKSITSQIEHNIFIFNLLSFPAFLLIIFIISIVLAKQSYSPINKIIDLANSISASNLSGRLTFEADSRDEIGRLRDTLNILFDRLEEQFDQIKDFTDNAAHQLMSPLTVINSELDYIQKKHALSEDTLESLKVLQNQTKRIIEITQVLLIMAKQKNEQSKKEVFNLSNLIEKDIKNYYKQAEIKLNIEKNIFVKGNNQNFFLVLQNLINNAIKYSPENSEVIVNLNRNNGLINLSVDDFGIGIPDSEKEKIFEKFYRSKESEKLGKRGFGLGLSLAKSVINGMEGELHIEDNQPCGTRFVVLLKALDLE